MKKNRMMTCLVAGVLLLSVSAFAAFGSVGGYGQYKEAVKALLLETDNVSYEGAFTVKVDGKTFTTTSLDGQLNDRDSRVHSKTENTGCEAGYYDESWDSTIDGTHRWFYSGDTEYYEETSESDEQNLMGMDTDEEWNQRLVNFTEIALDTMVGDLKNNFVQTDSKDGNKTYVVDISEHQVPSLINAGLSLAVYSLAMNNNYLHVSYADYETSMLNYYEQQTGETLSDEMQAYLFGTADENYAEVYTDAWYEANGEPVDRFYEVTDALTSDLYEKYDSGYAYVNADASVDYYETAEAFYAAHPEERSGGADCFDDGTVFGKDAALEQVRSEFTVDKSGNLTQSTTDVTFRTVDLSGNAHTVIVTLTATLHDYGTTRVEAFDPGDRTLYVDECVDDCGMEE